MIIFDALYGRFDLPADLAELTQIPEVRRLSQIRLLNTLTPSLGVLGELRRYSHTLGVLRLAFQSPLVSFKREEVRAFWAAVLLHDIGTPPFGHLLEYELRERAQDGWSHESFIRKMLWNFHAPENRAHQIFGGRATEAKEALARLNISLPLVDSIIQGKHPLSSLLFGSIDLDNIDNVSRMAWALGIGGGADVALRLASALAVSREGHLVLERRGFYEDVSRWAYLRRMVYEIIAFDAPTVAAQAVLTEALRVALDMGLLGLDDWSLYDEALLERLRKLPETKNMITCDYLGRLPVLAFCLQVPVALNDLGLGGRNDLFTLIREVMSEVFPREQSYPYVFSDRGAFEKRLVFDDFSTGRRWELGTTSVSTIFYGFVRSRDAVPQAKTRAISELLRQRIGVTSATSPSALIYPEVMSQNEDQIPLPFSAP